MSLQQVHLRINDAATGRPTPVRLRVTDAAGHYYPPHGHAAEFPIGRGEAVGGDLLIGRERWAYIDGACEIAVPPGELTVRAAKGPAYRGLRETIHLPPGKLALRFEIERFAGLPSIYWYSGDIRSHYLPPHAALLEAAAEDLAVVNVLARETTFHSADGQTYSTIPNLGAFSGQSPSLAADGHMVAVNTLNMHPVLGSLALLHCHRVVYPLAFGGPDRSDDWSLADWCGQCHRKKGLVIWVDAFNPRVGHAGEALANLILGDVDAIELNLVDPMRMRAWYHLLNAGFRVPIAGGSGKDSNRIPLGAVRTYAHCGKELSFTGWIQAVREGQTFVTTGPLMTFHVRGMREGTIHRQLGGDTGLKVHFAAYSGEAIERTDLVANGDVVATGTGPEVGLDVDLPSGGWVAARCWVRGKVVAHTSPQYVEVEGRPPAIDREAIGFLDGHLGRTRDWIVAEGRFEKPANRERLLNTINAARQTLLARLGLSGTIDAP